MAGYRSGPRKGERSRAGPAWPGTGAGRHGQRAGHSSAGVSFAISLLLTVALGAKLFGLF